MHDATPAHTLSHAGQGVLLTPTIILILAYRASAHVEKLTVPIADRYRYAAGFVIDRDVARASGLRVGSSVWRSSAGRGVVWLGAPTNHLGRRRLANLAQFHPLPSRNKQGRSRYPSFICSPPRRSPLRDGWDSTKAAGSPATRPATTAPCFQPPLKC
jgi:hypothetical protein